MTRPLLLGHRGARSAHDIPENSLPSFELCLQHGCDGFEFDVRRSSDGQAVICHDPVVRGMEIAKTPAALLDLPIIGEVLHSFGVRTFLDIELKVEGLEQQTVALLRQHPATGYVVSSFLPQALVALHELDAAIPLGFIFDNPSKMDLWQNLPVDWVMPQVELVNQALVTRLHDAGKKVMVWTVNDPGQIRNLAGWAIDAIISDHTQLAVKALKEI